MRLIDADVACAGCVRYGTSLSCEDCVVKVAPTVDAVPVVRCRECKYFKMGKYFIVDCSDALRNTDDFCSYGERKEGAD